LGVGNGIGRHGFLLGADAGKLRGRDPGSQEMDASADMLGDSKGGGKSVDSTGRVGQDGEFGHSEIITHNGNII
jgi:hypothetical protein